MRNQPPAKSCGDSKTTVPEPQEINLKDHSLQEAAERCRVKNANVNLCICIV